MTLGVTYTFWRLHKGVEKNWMDLVNHKYSVQFYNGQTQQIETAIDKKAVCDYQEGKTDLASSAEVKVAQITATCRFFSVQRIENDIDPREIITAEKHQELMGYLKAMSKTLNKPVLLTAENQPEMVYVIVENDKVKIDID